jgi:hypothetical protein
LNKKLSQMKTTTQHFLLFTALLFNSFMAFSQNSKKENNVDECIIILEAEGKKYCVGNLSYGINTAQKYDDVNKKYIENSFESTYFCSTSIPNTNYTQDLADWAFLNSQKKVNCTIKVYNPGKIKVIKEILLEEAYISGFSDMDDSNQSNSYLTETISFNCKKINVKINK